MALISALLMMIVMSALAIALTASGRVEVSMGDNEELYAVPVPPPNPASITRPPSSSSRP